MACVDRVAKGTRPICCHVNHGDNNGYIYVMLRMYKTSLCTSKAKTCKSSMHIMHMSSVSVHSHCIGHQMHTSSWDYEYQKKTELTLMKVTALLLKQTSHLFDEA